jgi:hypothetical protein
MRRINYIPVIFYCELYTRYNLLLLCFSFLDSLITKISHELSLVQSQFRQYVTSMSDMCGAYMTSVVVVNSKKQSY